MTIYKYVPAERIDILANGEIRFTHADALNDPFDLKPHFRSLANRDFLAEQLSGQTIDLDAGFRQAYEHLSSEWKETYSYEAFMAMFRSLPNANELMIEGLQTAYSALVDVVERESPNLVTIVQKGLREHLGILSLTKVPDSTLMWTHYAANNTGFVIEFDNTATFFNRSRSSTDECYYLRDVLYRDEPNTHDSLVGLGAEQFFLWKGREWEYEREQRMIAPLADASRTLEIEGDQVHLFGLPPNAVRGVILGAKISPARASEITDLVNHDARYVHLRLRRAEIGLAEQRVIIHDA